jgi:predicted DNA-binding transcriptional regulator YafY
VAEVGGVGMAAATWEATMGAYAVDGRDRLGVKRDRIARLLLVLRVLEANRDGLRPDQVATMVGVSRRTAYRDLKALEGEIGVPIWSDKGRWGVDERAFLPNLRLTLSEAMAVYLSARLMATYADEYDPDLASAFLKLAAELPAAIRGHIERTVLIMSRRRFDRDYTKRVHLLCRAWAESLVVTLVYDAGAWDAARPQRVARVHPWLIEPSAHSHALYLIGWDEDREAPRTFKIERMRDVSLTAERFDPPDDGAPEEALERAWGIIADQGDVEVVVRFGRGAAARVREAVWHPSQRIEDGPDGSIVWRATVSGTLEIRLWILEWGADAEVLAPPDLRADVARTLRAAAAAYAYVR